MGNMVIFGFYFFIYIYWSVSVVYRRVSDDVFSVDIGVVVFVIFVGFIVYVVEYVFLGER